MEIETKKQMEKEWNKRKKREEKKNKREKKEKKKDTGNEVEPQDTLPEFQKSNCHYRLWNTDEVKP